MQSALTQKCAQRCVHVLTTTSARSISTLSKSPGAYHRSNLMSSPLATASKPTTATTTPRITTEAQRFAPTSKSWNKKTSQSDVDRKYRKRMKQRYHGTNYNSIFPIMTAGKFKHLPRPLFIESEVLNMFLPAPQWEKSAGKQALTAAQQAQQRPY